MTATWADAAGFLDAPAFLASCGIRDGVARPWCRGRDGYTASSTAASGRTIWPGAPPARASCPARPSR